MALSWIEIMEEPPGLNCILSKLQRFRNARSDVDVNRHMSTYINNCFPFYILLMHRFYLYNSYRFFIHLFYVHTHYIFLYIRS